MCDTTRCTPFSTSPDDEPATSIPRYLDITIAILNCQVRVDKSKGDIGMSLTNNPSGVGVTVFAES